MCHYGDLFRGEGKTQIYAHIGGADMHIQTK